MKTKIFITSICLALISFTSFAQEASDTTAVAPAADAVVEETPIEAAPAETAADVPASVEEAPKQDKKSCSKAKELKCKAKKEKDQALLEN